MRNTLLSLLICATTSTFAQSLYFPPNTGKTWDTLSASSAGICPDETQQLYQFLQNSNSKAFILLQDGKIVLEKYFDQFTMDSAWYWASAGKSLTATLVGMAAEQGKINLADSSSKYLGVGWTSLNPIQESKITVWNQLTMTSGLNDGTGSADCTDPACLIYKADPGTRWAYHNAPYTLLDKVIESGTSKTLNQYFQSNLMLKTGITGLYLKTGYNNVFWSNARSFARFGLLTLAKGKWGNTSIYTDTSYFNQMTRTSQNLNKAYGYLWWLNGTQNYMLPSTQFVFQGSLAPQAPPDCYAAMGKNGQICCVIPSQNRVWIRMGNDDGVSLVPNVYFDSIWKYINRIYCNTNQIIKPSKPITFYPNPAQQSITFSPTVLNAQIITLAGKKYPLTLQNNGASLAHIPPGIYLLKLHTAAGIQTHKLQISL